MTFKKWWPSRTFPIYCSLADAEKIWDASRAQALKEAAEIARAHVGMHLPYNCRNCSKPIAAAIEAKLK